MSIQSIRFLCIYWIVICIAFLVHTCIAFLLQMKYLLVLHFFYMYYTYMHCISLTCITLTCIAFLFHVTQPIAFGVSFDLNPQSRLHWSLFNRTWQRNNRELDHRLRFETEEMTLQMPQAVLTCMAFLLHVLHFHYWVSIEYSVHESILIYWVWGGCD